MKRYLSKTKDFTFILLGILLGSCASQQEEKSLAVEKSMMDAASQNTSFSVPEAVSNTLLEANLASNKDIVRDERFDISVNGVPAKTFFLSLVADSGVNVVVHPEVAGVISLELKAVTVREVLNVVRDVYGYEYKHSSSIYTIYPRKLRTEVFPINYLDVQRVGVTDTSVLIGEITSNTSNSGNSNNRNNQNNSSNNGSGSSLVRLSNEGEETTEKVFVSPGARIQTLSKTDFWSGLNRALLEIVGGDKNGRFVMTNPQSGLVVVKAMPRELNDVRDFLEKSELSIKRQVVLETKILEVTLNDGFESGINWGAIGGQITLQQLNSAEDDALDSVLLDGAGTVESIISSVINITDITKLLFLLEQQGSVQVLSSPRVSTVNNQKAIIRVGSDEFFVTGISNSTTSSAGSIVTAPEVELDSFFSGISLDVTPQISEDGDVILHIHPLVSNVQDQIKEISISGETFSLPLALRDVRESDSIVKARSGQVVILGGLMQETTSKVNTKRPFLGNIPVLNTLFKSKQRSLQKTELVILMRPQVIGDESWQDILDEDVDRINSISELYRSR